MQKKSIDTLRNVLRLASASMPISDLAAYMEGITKGHTDNETQISLFCSRFDLGNWFYESLILNDINIRVEISRIIAERIQEESEALQDDMETEQTLRKAQGWPI